MLTVNTLERVFKFKDTKLSDPNPNFTPKDVLSFYSNSYPELTTASVVGPEVLENEAIYTFKEVVGTKG